MGKLKTNDDIILCNDIKTLCNDIKTHHWKYHNMLRNFMIGYEFIWDMKTRYEIIHYELIQVDNNMQIINYIKSEHVTKFRLQTSLFILSWELVMKVENWVIKFIFIKSLMIVNDEI